MTGMRVRAVYAKEAEFGTPPVDGLFTKIFGAESIISVNRNNQMNYHYENGADTWQTATAGLYQGRLSLNFRFCAEHFEWLEHAIGPKSTSGSGPFVHTFQRDITKILPSFSLRYSKFNKHIKPHAEDEVVTLKGCTVQSLKTQYENGSDAGIKVSMEVQYANESKATTGAPTYVPPVANPLTFGTLEMPIGTPVAFTDRSDISYANQMSMLVDNDSRFYKGALPGPLRININTQCRSIDPVIYRERMYGSATGPTKLGPTKVNNLSIYSSNGGLTTALRKLEFNFTDLYVDTDDQSFSPTQPILDRPKLTAGTMAVKVTNNTA